MVMVMMMMMMMMIDADDDDDDYEDDNDFAGVWMRFLHDLIGLPAEPVSVFSRRAAKTMPAEQ
eukprot:10125643-Karenia_brevis.AAC.1